MSEVSTWIETAASTAGRPGRVVPAVVAGFHRDSLHYLSREPDVDPEGGWPPLAVDFAARNEAEEVDAAARSMLSQDYPGLTVIAVDHRALCRSMFLTLRRGGVVWRGRLNPLAEPREHVRRRNAWAEELWRSTRRAPGPSAYSSTRMRAR